MNSPAYVTVTPAYGRDYSSKKDVKKDVEGNKDFRIQCFAHPYDGAVATVREVLEGGAKAVNVRYSKLRKLAVCRLKGGKVVVS